MIRAAAMMSMALLAATLGTAQNSSTSGAASGQTDSTLSTSSSTVRGCLSSSSLGDNHFTLTQDQTGTVFTLSGSSDQLGPQVGHEVEVTGTVLTHGTNSDSPDGPKTDSAKASGQQNKNGASAAGNNAFKVTDVRMLADHCTASSMSPPETPASPTAKPTSPTASTTGGSVMQRVALLGSNPLKPPNENLPVSSPVLPLLGVVGLCSLVAGFFVRR